MGSGARIAAHIFLWVPSQHLSPQSPSPRRHSAGARCERELVGTQWGPSGSPDRVGASCPQVWPRPQLPSVAARPWPVTAGSRLAVGERGRAARVGCR